MMSSALLANINRSSKDRPELYSSTDFIHWRDVGGAREEVEPVLQYANRLKDLQAFRDAELENTMEGNRLKGKAILSLNDHPEIRRVFGHFQMDTTGIQYNVGGGGRAVDRKELIIYSWDRAAEPVGLF